MTLRPGVHTVPTADRDAIPALMRAFTDAFEGMGPLLPLGPNRQQPAALQRWSPFGPSGWLAALPPNAAALVPTSGSTGEPKLVVLSAEAIQASAHATHSHLSGPGRWLLALPPHHIAGLQVVARSVVAGTTPAHLPPGPFTAAGFVETATPLIGRTDLPTYVSLVPTQLQRLIEDDAACQILAGFSAVLIGGAPLPTVLAKQARERGINVVRTYGMSETAGGCVYDGRPLPGVQWQLDADGSIMLRGPMLAEGYLGDRDLSAESFPVLDGKRWFRTSDLGGDVEGRLQVLGRLDDVIISGGVNIAPVQVEEVLTRHERVREAAVVGLDDPQWGQRVVALVTGTEDAAGADAPEAELRELVHTELGRVAVPKQIWLVEELPLLPSGKIDRAAARQVADSLSDSN